MAVTKGFEKVNRSAKKLRGNLAAGGGGGGGGMLGMMLGRGGVGGLAKAVPLLGLAVLAMKSMQKVAQGVGDAVDRIDSLAKTSQKLGMTINALNGLRFAGEQTGVSANTMDMALQRMTRRLAEAAQGSGEAKDAIKQLGLDAQQLAQMSPDKAFLEVTRAMKSVQQPCEKLRLAFKLFDSEGVALVNTMNAGADGIEEYMKKAEELQGITAEDAAKFEAFKDASNELSKAMEGLWQEIGIVLLPVLTDLLGIFKDIIAAVKDLFGWFGKAPQQAAVVKSVEKQAVKVAKVNAEAVQEIKKQQTDLLQGIVEPALAQMRPGVGAVTRGTTAGFSAVQRGREAARMAIEQRKQLLREAERQRKLLQDIKTNTAPGNAGVKINQVALAP